MSLSSPFATTDAQARWSERRIALLKKLNEGPQSVNHKRCAKIGPGVRPGTDGGDLRRLVREGFAVLEHKSGKAPSPQLLPSGERTPRPRTNCSPKSVAITQKGRDLLARHAPDLSKAEARPWSKRRQALLDAGLAKPSPSQPREPRGRGWG